MDIDDVTVTTGTTLETTSPSNETKFYYDDNQNRVKMISKVAHLGRAVSGDGFRKTTDPRRIGLRRGPSLSYVFTGAKKAAGSAAHLDTMAFC